MTRSLLLFAAMAACALSGGCVAHSGRGASCSGPSRTAALSGDEARAVEGEVRATERRWLDAYEQADAAAMDEIVADEFLIIHPEGRTETKAQIMASIARQKGRPGEYRHHTENVTARIYCDVAILSGTVVSKLASSNAPPSKSLYTDTYLRRDGRWRVVASHLSPAPQAPSR